MKEAYWNLLGWLPWILLFIGIIIYLIAILDYHGILTVILGLTSFFLLFEWSKYCMKKSIKTEEIY